MDHDEVAEQPHVPQMCRVEGCEIEATYWIDTEGFYEAMGNADVPSTFYLCADHQHELDSHDVNEGGYVHLRIDTGELHWMEIGKYCCHDGCEVCLSS